MVLNILYVHTHNKFSDAEIYLQINGAVCEDKTHDEVVQMLRSAGDTVVLTVRYFIPAALFLNKGRICCVNCGLRPFQVLFLFSIHMQVGFEHLTLEKTNNQNILKLTEIEVYCNKNFLPFLSMYTTYLGMSPIMEILEIHI